MKHHRALKAWVGNREMGDGELFFFLEIEENRFVAVKEYPFYYSHQQIHDLLESWNPPEGKDNLGIARPIYFTERAFRVMTDVFREHEFYPKYIKEGWDGVPPEKRD